LQHRTRPVDQDGSGYGVGMRTITVTGHGSAGATPDTVDLVVGVRVRARSASAAMAEASAKQRGLVEALRAEGIGSADLQTRTMSCVATTDDRGARVTGYEVSSTVDVRSRDVGGAGALIDAVVVAAAGALVVRICLRSVRWSREGLTVRGFLTTGHYAWSDVDHVTAEASETTTKSGQYWTLVPALVLTSGERIRLGVFSQTEGGWFQPFRSSIAQKALSRYDILDAWLASASIPVDVAYEALRPWKLGRVSTSEVVALSDSPPAGLHRAPEPGSSIAAPQVSVAAAPVPGEFAGFAEPSVTPPAPRPRSSVAVRVLLILGALLVALPALFLVVGTPLLVYQLATGRQVAAVVETRVGDQCVLVDNADGSSSWTTRCLGDWQPRQTVQVVISSQGKPMTWVDTTAGLIALAVFCIPGVMLLTIGLLLRRRQRRHRPSSSGQDSTRV